MLISLIIFSKAPIPGYAKRRLIPSIGKQRAAELQQEMTTAMVTQALAADIGETNLFCAPDTTHELFQNLARQHSISLVTQQGESLGDKMSHAIETTFTSSKDTQNSVEAVILMGSDCPQLNKEKLLRVSTELKKHEIVLIPATDGGYVLIAMRNHYPTLFQNINWGSDQVMSTTIQRIDALAVSWSALPALTDIDCAEDLFCRIIDLTLYGNPSFPATECNGQRFRSVLKLECEITV